MSYIKIFNQLIEEFFNELIEIFPENNAIKVQHELFKTIIKVNVKKPANEFMTKIIPYLEKVALRDDQVFLGDDAPEILSKLRIEKEVLAVLSKNTKDALWKYIVSFLSVGVNIIEMPEETHSIINYILNRK
jgi:hypothetical protein